MSNGQIMPTGQFTRRKAQFMGAARPPFSTFSIDAKAPTC